MVARLIINFDKGSKRRLRQVRWKRHEIVSAVLLFLVLTVLCLWFALREAYHDHSSDLPKTPQAREITQESGDLF